MKKLFGDIDSNERVRILEMHKRATEKNYLIKEDESSEMAQAQQELKMENLEMADAGIPPIQMETLEKFVEGKDVSAEENEINIPSPDVTEEQKENLKNQLRSKICMASRGELKAERRKLLDEIKNKEKLQEQVVPITILGITAAPAVFLAIAGFILMLILIRLIRWLSNRDNGGYGCRGRESWNSLMRRIQ